ncbi:hypothetical protein [Variovorax sp. PBL-E5]|uniref:hypothetical protein n=1 Tax=Variovorax sp. PBL-E5 TaxID=434014 RepID=UPI0013175E2E|nr:hypothetical protein [Variovorax sp. PBL-E5]VTU18545.1 hypothetical protein E5CHR_00609 [Variovorax sp. PBL-E5]
MPKSFQLLFACTFGAAVALGPAAARADEADGSQHVLRFHSELSRADLHAGALDATRNATTAPLLSQETAPPTERSGLDRAGVTAAAEEAQRDGQIPSGRVDTGID